MESKSSIISTRKQLKAALNKPERHVSEGPLTDKEIKSAKPWTFDYQMAEPGGLRIIIKTNGAKWWHFRYRFRGVEKQVSMGVYPDVSLAEARKACNEARLLIAKDVDPLA